MTSAPIEAREKSAGRPMKYADFLSRLDDETVYTPALIVNQGEKRGLLARHIKNGDLALARLRIRHSLARFSANHGFPDKGDGYIKLKGQPPHRGWYGWRWKEAMP